jgi:hypothetical protein
MKHPRSLPAALLPFVAAFAASASRLAAEEPAFVPLFPEDGAPAGWVVRHWADLSKPASGDAVWTVKDGVLRGSATRGTWLVSEKTFGDFELEFEFKLSALGNSGCALRSPMKGDPAFDGLELQMVDLRYKPDANPAELTGGLYRAAAPREQIYKPEAWNRYHITLAGPRIKVVLNGTVILDDDLADLKGVAKRHDGSAAPLLKDRPRRGHLGFQELSRDGGQVEIRGARIKVLDAGKAAPGTKKGAETEKARAKE